MLKIAILAAVFVLTVNSKTYDKPCPNDVPMVKCDASPCEGFRNQVCVVTFCGVCKANCFAPNGRKQPCKFEGRRNKRNWTSRHRRPGRFRN